MLAAEQLGHLSAEVEDWGCSRVDALPKLGLPTYIGRNPSLEYLMEAFLMLSPARGSALGIEPWDWSNVMAFCSKALPEFEFWEAKALFDMSKAYCSRLNDKDPMQKSPIEKHFGDDLKTMDFKTSKDGLVKSINLTD